MKFRIILVLLFSALLLVEVSFPQNKGKLVIVGGVQVKSIMKKFVELAGGANSKIIIIPNAGSEPVENSIEQVKEFKELGGNADYLIFTRETADDESNLKKIDNATAFYFLGGDQSDLTRDMLGTKLLGKVFELYNKGGLVGGTSAGAAVMSEVMITGNELINKDTERNFVTIEKGNVETTQGFGFLKTVVIDQHFLKRKRHNRTISTLIENPKLIGVAIDESTAIIVNPDDTFEVIGDYQVLVYDPTNSNNIRQNSKGNLGISEMKLHVLIEGDKFNLKTGKVIE
ncbi:MAG TPA: cyanophycinase [Ignavibacteriaceae bacterium]|nr:cyanophycinase [Ignavibacteriaceae bacterium]